LPKDLLRVGRAIDGEESEGRTFLKEKVPEDRVCRHLGIDGDDATPDNLISGVGGEEVVDALVDVVKGVVDLLEPAPLGEVCCTGQHGGRG